MNQNVQRPAPILLDSIALFAAAMDGAVVVSGSHGGMSAAHYAAGQLPAAKPLLVIFNDAGRGKDDAGISGLAWLAERGIAAAAVGCWSARIGEAGSTLKDGVISAANGPALDLGVALGAHCRDVVARILGGGPG
jgi:hypothetical protein